MNHFPSVRKMVVLILWLLCGGAFAEPIAVVSQGALVLTLTDEPCALPAIANLPHRAIWVEKGETIEGCWRWRGETVLFYFADRTVMDLPVLVFRRAEGV